MHVMSALSNAAMARFQLPKNYPRTMAIVKTVIPL